MRLLIKLPTRERPQRLLPVLREYCGRLSGKHEVRLLVATDPNDATMSAPEVQAELRRFPQVTVCSAAHRNKVHAYNSFLNAYPFDILFSAADDLLPIVDGYDDIIARAMQQFFPNTDGILCFGDGIRNGDLYCHPALGRKYFERFGYLCHPSYVSMFGDNELTEVAVQLGRHKFVPQTLFRHEHWVVDRSRMDPLYQRNQSYYRLDEENFRRRRAINFGLPTMAGEKHISVLLPTRGRFDKLAKATQSFVHTCSDPDRIEILLKVDDDDEDTLRRLPELPHEKITIRTIISGRRQGYRSLYEFVNEMCAISRGLWLFGFNDDTQMMTPGWDREVAKYDSEVVVLKPTTGDRFASSNLFPIIHRKIYDVLGHVSQGPHGDTWMEFISRWLGIERSVAIRLFHDRHGDTASEADQTFLESQAVCKSTSVEFYSPQMHQKRVADAQKLQAYLQSFKRVAEPPPPLWSQVIVGVS